MQLFRSATLKLTVWYLAILMLISLSFSVVIYQVSLAEVDNRLETLQHNLLDDSSPSYIRDRTLSLLPVSADDLRKAEISVASKQIVLALVYVNVIVLLAGGVAAYAMAKRTLRPIEDAHEAQSRFTSDASHELRTPLAAMKAELEVYLRDENLTVDEARDLLDSNLEEVDKLINLSEMLLHLSRLEYDKLEVSRIDMTLIASNLVDKNPESKRFELSLRRQAITQANEAAVTEVMEILIDNALKYSTPDSPIKIRVFGQAGYVAFRIKNSGPPISKKSISRLFDRFYRDDKSRTGGRTRGYGLGLSIAKKIIDIHGGYITASSNSKETSFTFFLPIVKSR